MFKVSHWLRATGVFVESLQTMIQTSDVCWLVPFFKRAVEFPMLIEREEATQQQDDRPVAVL